jgi:hypothetical protein
MQTRINDYEMFVGNDVGMLMGLLRRIKATKDSIVLTTSADSKGVDFLFATQQAYVIHLALPNSLV